MRTINSLITVVLLSLMFSACATAGDEDEFGDVDGEAAAPGQVDVRGAGSAWQFDLFAGNKNLLVSSEVYTTRTSAIGGVLSLLKNGVDPNRYVLVEMGGKWGLQLNTGNGRVLGLTETYSTKSNAKRAIGACVRAVTSYLDKVYTSTSRAHVDTAQDDAGKFSFTVHAKDGSPLVVSKGYASEASAINGAFAIQAAATAGDLRTVKVQATEGAAFSFTLTSTNFSEIATSAGTFATADEALAAANAARKGLATIDVL